MKLEFDDLRLVEANMLTEVLISFRAGRPFHWPPGSFVPVSNEPAKPETGVRSSQLRQQVTEALTKSNGQVPPKAEQ